MIPYSQIIDRVRTLNEAESSVRWSNSAIGDAVNEGLEDLSEVTRFYERHVTIPIGSRRNYYDLRGFLPENALGVTSVWCSLTETWLNPRSPQDMRSRWEQSVGPPLDFFMRGLFWLVVFPRAESSTGYLRVYFAATAPRFTFPQDVIRDLSDEFVPALEEYTLYELAAQDGETTRALLHWEQYAKKAEEIANFVERRTVSARTMTMGNR